MSSSYGVSPAGQESLHAYTDTRLFGELVRQPADSEVEHAEAKGAEDRHAFRTVPRGRLTEHDISQRASNEFPAAGRVSRIEG
jgi:FKBP-type peptidyl-prolyl cis-trans isomerase 2